MIPDREPISTGFSSGDAPSIVAPNVPGLQDGVAQAVSAVCESELADQVLDVSGEGLPAASSLLADIPQADIDRLAEALAKLLASWWRSQQAEADGASQAAVPEPLAA